MKYLFDYRNSMIFSFHGLTRAAGSRGTAERRWAQMETLSKELRPPKRRGEASSDQREARDDRSMAYVRPRRRGLRAERRRRVGAGGRAAAPAFHAADGVVPVAGRGLT